MTWKTLDWYEATVIPDVQKLVSSSVVASMQDYDEDDIELGEPILRKCYYCGKPTSRTKNSVPTCKGCDRHGGW